jgi:hypothetical protein
LREAKSETRCGDAGEADRQNGREAGKTGQRVGNRCAATIASETKVASGKRSAVGIHLTENDFEGVLRAHRKTQSIGQEGNVPNQKRRIAVNCNEKRDELEEGRLVRNYGNLLKLEEATGWDRIGRYCGKRTTELKIAKARRISSTVVTVEHNAMTEWWSSSEKRSATTSEIKDCTAAG